MDSYLTFDLFWYPFSSGEQGEHLSVVSEGEKSPDDDLFPGLLEPENLTGDLEDIPEVRLKDRNAVYLHAYVCKYADKFLPLDVMLSFHFDFGASRKVFKVFNIPTNF